MATGELTAIFLACAGDANTEAGGDALEDSLRARIDAGRAGWPAIALDDDTFVRHLAGHVEAGRLPPLEHAAELWLACACASGARGAAATFDRVYRGAIERAVARVDRSVVDESTQAVLASLLVRDPPDVPPRIARYGGRAALGTWLATVGARTALNQRRRRDDQAHESLTGLVDAVAGREPELAIAKARYAPEFEEALRAGLATLADRQRVLLRLHHAEGWSIDRLAALYRVGRSTAARWLTAARERLYDETKRVLRERLQITPTELESLVVLLRNELEVSLVRMLERE